MGRRRCATGMALVLVTLAGCGGGGDRGAARAPATATREQPPPTATGGATTPPSTTPAPANDPFALPAGVPTRATAPADEADLRVVRAWARDLTRGRIERAARRFAFGAKVQNTTPVLTLRTKVERRIFTESFPCGSTVEGARGAKGYALVTFRLSDRAGSKCSGSGALAAAAIKVRDGRMIAWYRLPDPGAPAADPGTPS